MSGSYYEDFHVGQRFTSRAVSVTLERALAYSQQFDPQPMHIDAAAAARGAFKGLIASGWHTVALTLQLQDEAAFSATSASDLELNWLRPVRPGDALHVVVEVKEMRPSPSAAGNGLISFLTTTVNQAEEPVQTMLGTVIVPTRPER